MASLLNSRRAWAIALVTSAVLWYPTAYPWGMVVACLDHLLGRREVKTYGYRTALPSAYARLLRDRYGVQLHTVGQCEVPPHLRWYAKGYNAVAVGLVNREYGKDVFEECAELARREEGD
jgi:hypothetical protein